MRASARVTEVGSRPIASMLHSIHGVMTGAGARLVDLKRGQPIQVQKYEEFRFNTFEASMVCMNALRSAQQPHPSLSKVWNSSGGKKALAQGLVTADWATLAAAMEQAVRSGPSWQHIGPVLTAIMAVDSVPRVSVNRDGKANEEWACKRLSSSLPPGWSLMSSTSIIEMHDDKMEQQQGQVQGLGLRQKAGLRQGQRQPANVKLGQRGLKGEMDALLIDPQGICQGIVEVKIGGSSPFRTLHDDLDKLLRLVKLVQGRKASLLGGGTAQFSAGVLPVYLVVRDSEEPLDAQEAVAEAERHLLKINVSMALGKASSWRSGVKLLQVEPEVVVVAVPDSVVRAMQQRVSRGFFRQLQHCEVYDVARPEGASCVHPTPPGLGSMWNSSGKKVIAQGLVTADWAALAAAIQQAKVIEDGTEASPTKLIRQGTEASSELALSKGHIELDAAQGRAVQAMPLSPSLSRAIHLTEIVVDWCKAVRSGPSWQHIGPVLTAIMAVDPVPRVSVNR
ncbi:hypothetical protein QJQ45_022226 [Haematococcus lacustris]|nr:hypothetical protein QJQ45_022226 [Haematococcus lacustris]